MFNSIFITQRFSNSKVQIYL